MTTKSDDLVLCILGHHKLPRGSQHLCDAMKNGGFTEAVIAEVTPYQDCLFAEIKPMSTDEEIPPALAPPSGF